MNEKDYMLRAIELAKRGGGHTAPNPMVGAVIVKNGKIIGEGYHRKCGELHAERNAIASLKESAEGATIYVTLEPCCHYGKTPPCTEAIIENKIAKVVVGSRDPNPLVSGKGAKLLREHGIEVVEDFMKEECDEINPVFFHYITTKKPYVLLKYAMTLDGKIACRTGDSKWITGEEARKDVQKLRGELPAILAGIGTVLADDPMLNCRIEGAHQPLRIIIDSKLRIPLDSNLVKTAKEYPTLIACALNKDLLNDTADKISEDNADSKRLKNKVSELKSAGTEIVSFRDENGKVDLKTLMAYLGERQISGILVEGGGEIHEAFLRAGLADHVSAYIAPKIFGGRDAKTPVEGLGVSSPGEGAVLKNVKIRKIGDDLLIDGDVKKCFN